MAGAASVLFATLSLASPTPVIRNISLTGNHAFSASLIFGLLSSRQGAPFGPRQLAKDAETVCRRYRMDGYYFAEVGFASPVFSPDSAFVDLRLNIEEGVQVRIGTLELEGNTAFSRDDILRQFDSRVGGFLDSDALEHDIDMLLTRYERSGYPFTYVSIDEISQYREDSILKLRLVLRIDEGEKVQISEIRVSGNTETSEHVIVREAGVRSGDYYNQDQIGKIPQRLNRMNIFSHVDEPEFYVKKNGAGGLHISVQEGNASTFDGVLGYVPAAGSEGQGYLMGLVNVTMKNLFGTARKLNVRWQRDDQHSQELAAQYVEPWVFDIPLDAGVMFQQRQQDTSFVRRSVELKADLRVGENFTVGGVFDQENVIPSSSAGVSLSNSRTVTTGLNVRYDSRDDIYSPTNGVYCRNDYQFGHKTIFGLSQNSNLNDRFTVQKISFDAEFLVQPSLRQVVAFGVHGRQLTSDDIEAGDLYRFGGATTLRGYRENQFLGSRIAWTNTEYRFLLARRSYFFGFFDTGYYFLPGDGSTGMSSVENLKYGYGVGIRLETSLGNIGVSFALGQGDPFSQAKIHIGLINDF